MVAFGRASAACCSFLMRKEAKRRSVLSFDFLSLMCGGSGRASADPLMPCSTWGGCFGGAGAARIYLSALLFRSGETSSLAEQVDASRIGLDISGLAVEPGLKGGSAGAISAGLLSGIGGAARLGTTSGSCVTIVNGSVLATGWTKATLVAPRWDGRERSGSGLRENPLKRPNMLLLSVSGAVEVSGDIGVARRSAEFMSSVLLGVEAIPLLLEEGDVGPGGRGPGCERFGELVLTVWDLKLNKLIDAL